MMREINYEEPIKTLRKLQEEHNLTIKQMSAYIGMGYLNYRGYCHCGKAGSPLSLDTVFAHASGSNLACRVLVDGVVLKTKEDVNDMFRALTAGIPMKERDKTFKRLGNHPKTYYWWKKSIKVDNLKRYCDATGHIFQMFVGLEL